MASRDNEDHIHPVRIANPQMRFDAVGDKRLKAVQKVAWGAGWCPKRTKNGIMWLAPDGAGTVALHGTDSDHRAHANALREFRNAGLDI